MTKDNVLPDRKWEFNEEVAGCFDDMLARSIPQYDAMREATFQMACRFAQRNTDIVDLGCSRGGAIARLVDKFGVNNRFVGIEVSEPMLEAARTRFSALIRAGVVKILDLDLRNEYPPTLSSVTLSVLTLQFTPIEYRLQILQNIYDHLVPGGALLLVEKVIGATAYLDRTLVDIYYGIKAENGYNQDQIERKRLSLEGVLVPVPARFNEDMLYSVGFRHVDSYWRYMNFAGWVAVKM